MGEKLLDDQPEGIHEKSTGPELLADTPTRTPSNVTPRVSNTSITLTLRNTPPTRRNVQESLLKVQLLGLLATWFCTVVGVPNVSRSAGPR